MKKIKSLFGVRKALSFALAACMLLGITYLPASATTVETGYIDLTGLTEYNGIKLATGATVTKDALMKTGYTVNIVDFGAKSLESREDGDANTYAVENTAAINAAIADAAEKGGGTVICPAGTFRSYTIELESNVNIYLDDDCVIQAARTEITGRTQQISEGGNYLQPEVNIYAGLQDGGHTYFANSLFYAADKENIMIYGEGLVDGSQMKDNGELEQVLLGNDPGNPADRTGQTTTWYGNKGISLVRCNNIVLADFDMLNGGHFAIIAEGCKDMLVENMIIDTNRDAYNIDCCQDVTIRNSVFNSLTDDAIVFKASYGAGIFMPVQNCLVYDCIVSGYDAGSVLAGTYTTDKQVASDRCGPTARIKFGTESTCGYNTVTMTDITFDRSRGLCMESVDGAELHDILLVNSTMDTVSSSPIYIRIGNRGRAPVTGNSTSTLLSQPNNVRLTNNGWIIPQNSGENEYTWQEYPIQRYFPAYNYTNRVTMSNGVTVSTVAQAGAARLNTNNYYYDEETEAYYEFKWDSETKSYVVNYDAPISTANEAGVNELYYYGDAVGFENIAKAYNIYVGNVEITNVDPRYPITLAGLTDSKIKNVTFENISVTYRGGMRMADAVEQQQLETSWQYTQYMTAPSTQSIPWLSNTFFSKYSALLPRVVWNAETESWIDSPYNVPEMNEQYPEPSNFGILPAYGMYARHVDGLKLIGVSFDFEIDDERHSVVLDDCHNVTFDGFAGKTIGGVDAVALINNNYKRATGFEYVENQPYFSTACTNITGLDSSDICERTVNAPEPGTPADSLYAYNTVASTESGYSYGENVWVYNDKEFNLPVTVHRPFFNPVEDMTAKSGDTLEFTLYARNPAAETIGVKDQEAADATLVYYAGDLPDGASFDPETKTFTWNTEAPERASSGDYQVTFYATDGVLPVSVTVNIRITGVTASISDRVSQLVANRAAVLPYYVTGGNAEGDAAYIVLGDETVYAPVADGVAIFKLSAAQTNVSPGNYEIGVEDSQGNKLFTGHLTVTAEPVSLWTANALIAEGKTVVSFAAPVSLASGSKVTVNGNEVSAAADENLVIVEAAEAGTVILKGVVFPSLYPSYKFTFTVTAE